MFTSKRGARVVLDLSGIVLAGLVLASVGLVSCGGGKEVRATGSETPGNSVSVAVATAARKTLEQHLTVSSELVPYQEIDVFAKESGYVKKLNVDYGSHVKAGDILAVLEIPELEAQLQQDDAAIKAADEQVQRLGKLAASMEARRVPLQELYERIATVAKEHPGLVIPQEVDDAQGRALTAQSDVDAANANIEAAKSNAEQARAKRLRDAVLYDYRNVKAEFDGVVTQRYANLGTLLQAGTSSSTQAMPLVRLSQDDVFRLVIPVEESYVRYIHLGDPVSVEVPSLNRTFSGKIKRFSEDVAQATRTMHTEVEVLNPDRTLKPGLYANATIQLQQNNGAFSIPLEALDRQADRASVDVVDPSNQIEVRKVTTGIETANDIEILSGVKQGELVVVGDRSGLKAGQAVTPRPVDVTEYKEQQ
jgi:RND family efflux transporter MFP subunit